jgi:protein TonB
MTLEGERFDRFVVASVFLHGALFAFVILSPKLFLSFGPAWGSPTGGSGGIQVKVVGNLPGVPLPAPAVVQDNAPASDSPAFYKSEPAPPPPPDKTAELIPEKSAPVKAPKPKEQPKAPAAKSAPAAEPPPSNAIPASQGGRPSMNYGAFSTGAGQAGVGFGDSAFGDRFGTYVDGMTRRISQNWLKSLVDSRVASAPRVYLEFEIARDGTVSNVTVQQSSNNPSLDRSAQRAILASSPLAPLPTDYRGGNVKVRFYFEYSK